MATLVSAAPAKKFHSLHVTVVKDRQECSLFVNECYDRELEVICTERSSRFSALVIFHIAPTNACGSWDHLQLVISSTRCHHACNQFQIVRLGFPCVRFRFNHGKKTRNAIIRMLLLDFRASRRAG